VRQISKNDNNLTYGITAMTAKSDRLSFLSDAEEEALYGLPNFDEGQQLEYLALSEAEVALVTSRPACSPGALHPANRLLQGKASLFSL
jgi:hypothetical protein